MAWSLEPSLQIAWQVTVAHRGSLESRGKTCGLMGLRQGGWGEDVTKRALSSVSLWRSREQESVYCLKAPYRRLKNKTSSRSACGEQEGGWDFLGSAVSLNRRLEPACFWSHLERESLLPFRPLQSKGSHTWNLSITAWVTDVLFSHSLDNLCSAFSYIIIWYFFFLI